MRKRNDNEQSVYSLFTEVEGKRFYLSSWNSYYYGFELCENPLYAIHWDDPKQRDLMSEKVKNTMGVTFKPAMLYCSYEDVGDIL